MSVPLLATMSSAHHHGPDAAPSISSSGNTSGSNTTSTTFVVPNSTAAAVWSQISSYQAVQVARAPAHLPESRLQSDCQPSRQSTASVTHEASPSGGPSGQAPVASPSRYQTTSLLQSYVAESDRSSGVASSFAVDKAREEHADSTRIPDPSPRLPVNGPQRRSSSLNVPPSGIGRTTASPCSDDAPSNRYSPYPGPRRMSREISSSWLAVTDENRSPRTVSERAQHHRGERVASSSRPAPEPLLPPFSLTSNRYDQHLKDSFPSLEWARGYYRANGPTAKTSIDSTSSSSSVTIESTPSTSSATSPSPHLLYPRPELPAPRFVGGIERGIKLPPLSRVTEGGSNAQGAPLWSLLGATSSSTSKHNEMEDRGLGASSGPSRSGSPYGLKRHSMGGGASLGLPGGLPSGATGARERIVSTSSSGWTLDSHVGRSPYASPNTLPSELPQMPMPFKLKPPLPYVVYMRQVILDSPERRLTLTQVYQSMETRWPEWFPRPADPRGASGWRNTIRHHLSYSRIFVRVDRQPHEKGNGCFWTVDESVPLPKSAFVASSQDD